MTFIKKIVMHGFKSFANKTEVLFDQGMNVIVGPNGSGKSNVSDALCFALGRLSIKSMRAAKAKNLIFMGSKMAKPAQEAWVELVFDNANKTFAIDAPEVALRRVVKKNGQSVYKINGQTKTRGDVVETLAHAGIDPHGFNMVLQGQIQAIVKAHPDERRKIIEEVAGIAIYESRKEKSLKELEKTDVRLKEVGTVLRERTGFLKNLERERAQALRFKELETTIKKCKASIVNKKMEDKSKELESIKKSIEEKIKQKDKFKIEGEKVEGKIDELNDKINQINRHIQKATGTEQESLRENIANLRAELEGLRVRKENYENRAVEIDKRMEQMQAQIPEYEAEISGLRKESPLVAQKQAELAKKKEELAKIEEDKKRVYGFKTEFQALKERLRDKEGQLVRIGSESDGVLKSIEELSADFNFGDFTECEKAVVKFESNLKKAREAFEGLKDRELRGVKKLSGAESVIASAEEVKGNIEGIDVCPLCQNKMTDEHRGHVNLDSNNKIGNAKKVIAECEKVLEEIKVDREKLSTEILKMEEKIRESSRELNSHRSVVDKQEYLKKLVEQEKALKVEVVELEKRREDLEKKTLDSGRIEEQYDTKIREIEEISSRTEKDLDTTLMYKERELESMKDVIKRSTKDAEEVSVEIAELSQSIVSKKAVLEEKESEEKAMSEKFKQMFEERDELQRIVSEETINLSNFQRDVRAIEDQVNYLKIGNAKIDAEREALGMELQEFSGVELIKAPINVLQERLQRSQSAINGIGSINMRALEVYEEVKAEYDRVNEKVETLQKEKEDIMKIIEEIDKKKKRTFMRTFKGINELFKRNFSQLSRKGEAYLAIANKEDIFSGGVDIVVKLGKGKYFDVTSLSGGEQTLIALSLLFAIQEHKPYHFYIFDEIDAALDKRNSERLNGLLKKYKQAGQYLVVTHNDAIITDSNVLYGVTMQEGISKILSLKID